jgi:hypothetical protein
MRKLLLIFVFILFSCKGSDYKEMELNLEHYITQMNDERIIIIDNDRHMANFFTKNGLLINRVNLITMESEKTDLTLRLETKIHDWNDTVFVRAELIGDKLYWYARTSGMQTRNADNLHLSSGGGMYVYLCRRTCDWNPVYDSKAQKSVYYSASGVVNNITLEEFSNITHLGYTAQSRR